MKRLLIFTLAMLIVLPLSSYAEKAKSIDELAKMYDVSSCKQCHPKQYEEWEKSYHAISLVGSSRTMATIASTVKDGIMKEWTYSGVKDIKDIRVEHMLGCLKCHLPQIKDATDEVAQEIAKAAIDGAAGDEEAQKKLKKLGINCLICHNRNAIVHKWTDGEPDKDAVYGTKEGAHGDSKYTKLKKSPIMTESILCGQCHGLGPNFDLPEPTQCATLYGSYLHAYVPSGGSKTCQECHMKENKKGHFMPAYRDPDQAKKAVNVEVDARAYYFLMKAGDSIPTAYVTVKLSNNAGHRIPDGWPSPNRLVLDVTAKTKDGNVVFNTSKIYTPQSPAKGRGDKMVYGPFRKSGMLADTSLQPGQTMVETFEIKFPYEDVEKEGKKERVVKAKEMDVTIQLWYLPAGGDHKKGIVGKDQFLFFETTKTVSVK